jgi:serine/threonine protein kinase/WD40 repeat protein
MNDPDDNAVLAASAGTAPTDPRLAEALEAYRRELIAGRRPDRRTLRARYPDLVDALDECLDALDFLHAAAQDLSHPQPALANAGVRPPNTLGDFRLLRPVGRGGMGVVYEAEQISLGRRVALKLLPPASGDDPRQLQRFHNEARAAACLHHPNIVPVYAVGTDRNVPYYAMQFIDGRTLAAVVDALRERAPASDRSVDELAPTFPGPAAPAADTDRLAADVTERGPSATPAPVRTPAAETPAYFRTMARLAVQAARALDHAHQSGVVHRDVKPANLLLDLAGNVWVTDFGLAHFLGGAGVTATGDLVGTLRYMSPEQALGQRGYLDHRTDVYSLGATLYELVTLQTPFPGEDRADVLRRLLHEEPTPARRVNPRVPIELETIVAKAMAKSPAERYATAQELADDLERFLDDRPIQARRPGPLVRTRKWARRHLPIVVSLGVSLALCLAAAVVGLLVYAGQQEELANQREAQELRAKQALYRTLLGRATALRLAHEAGYRKHVWDDLREAVALKVPENQPAQVRAEVLACLGDPIGLDPTNAPTVKRAAAPSVSPFFQKLLQKQFQQEPKRVAASADGRFLATTGGVPFDGRLNQLQGMVLLWNNQGTFAPAPLFLGDAHDMKFTADGTGLIAGCDEGVIRWSVPGQLSALPGGVRTSFRAGNITSIAVHPGGRLLATAGRRIDLWSLNSNLHVASFPVPVDGTKVEFSADGELLLAIDGRDQARRGWPVTRTPEKHVLDGHGAGVPAVAFSRDGRLLASASKDHSLRLWDGVTGQLRYECPGHATAIEAVAFSPDNRLVASGDIFGGIRLWDTTTGNLVAKNSPTADPPGQIWRLQFAPSGKFLAAGGQQGIAVYPLRYDGPDVQMETARRIVPRGDATLVYDLAIHPGTDTIVFKGFAAQLQRADPQRDDESQPMPIAAQVVLRGLHFDAAGRRLTYVRPDRRLGVWDWHGETVLSTGPKVFQLALDPAGCWAATSTDDQRVLVCDVAAGRPVLALPPEGSDVWAVAWSPDATRLAVGMSDGGVAVWDLEQVRTRLSEFGLAIPTTRFERAAR